MSSEDYTAKKACKCCGQTFLNRKRHPTLYGYHRECGEHVEAILDRIDGLLEPAMCYCAQLDHECLRCRIQSLLRGRGLQIIQ